MEALMAVYSPATDTDIYWSIGLTLEQMLAICWRVRQWRWSGNWTASASVEGGANDGSTANFTATVAQLVVPSLLIRRGGASGLIQIIDSNAKEPFLVSTPNQVPQDPPLYATKLPYSTLKSRGLVRTGSVASGFNVTASDDSPFADYGGTIPRSPISFIGQAGGIGAILMSTLSGALARGFDVVVFDSDLFYPYVDFGLSSVGFGGIFLNATAAREPHPTLPTLAMGTVTVRPIVAPDFSFELFLTAEYTGPGDATVSAGASLDLTLTAEEFHPYTNRLGQAVYNTTTGAQENDPFG